MIICGTYGAKAKSCNNCNYFMLWGVSYGHCMKHNEDFPAQHVCNKFKKYTDVPWKQVFVNNKRYDIDLNIDKKKAEFMIHNNYSGITIGHYHTLRDAMNAIKKDAFK